MNTAPIPDILILHRKLVNEGWKKQKKEKGREEREKEGINSFGKPGEKSE